jgi:hypothetical protein
MATTTARTTPNGSEAAEPTVSFPVDSFRDAAKHLRRPFTPAAVKFKVQATWPKENPTGGLIVAYIDARLVVERLNLIVPHLWHDAYRPVGGGQMWCDLTIDDITRSDVGEGAGKGLVSDALKRAAVKFGIGVSLYATPKLTLKIGSGLELGGRDKVRLTAEGERMAQSNYKTWLESHGTSAFGESLDHGDVEGAQGDAEIDAPPEPDAPALVTESDIEELKAAAKGLKVGQVRLALGSVGLSAPEGVAISFAGVPAAVAPALAEALVGMERTS